MLPSTFDPPIKAPHHSPPKTAYKPSFYLLSIFKYAGTSDIILLCLALILVIASATCFPVFSWALASFIELISSWQNNSQHVTDFALIFVVLVSAAFAIVIAFNLSRSLMHCIAKRQVSRFRNKSLEVMINSAIRGSTSSQKSCELALQLEEDCNFLLDVLGPKLATLLWTICSVFLLIGVALFRGWQLALLSLIPFPIIFMAFNAYRSIISDSQSYFSTLYIKADTIVRQILCNIKTVVGLGGEYKELERYKTALLDLERKIEPHFIFQAFALGGPSFLFYVGFGLSLYIGNIFLQDSVINMATGQPYRLDDILCVTLCIYICIPIMYFAAPSLNALAETEPVLTRFFSVIESEPTQTDSQRSSYLLSKQVSAFQGGALSPVKEEKAEDCELDQELIPHHKKSGDAEYFDNCQMSPINSMIWLQKQNTVTSDVFNFDQKSDSATSNLEDLMRNSYKSNGKITLHGVTLMSNKKEEHYLLDDVMLEISAKKTTAVIVKENNPQRWISNFFKLIQGIIRPERGFVTLGNSDIHSVDQEWVRDNMFEIPEESIIFPMTIKENLTLNKMHLTDEEIWRIIDSVDCEGLLLSIRKNLDKQVGLDESQLSQQDKKMIGILRAIIANPSILLINGRIFEGPDSHNISKILQKISKNKTIIIACPSMESIKGVETILVVEHGKIEEFETHGKRNRTLNLEDLNCLNRMSMGTPKSLSRNNSARNSAPPCIEIKVDPNTEEENEPLIEKINSRDLQELNDVLGSYDESMIMTQNNDSLEEYYERLWQLVQTEASTFLFALLPTLANSVLVPLVITLLAKVIGLMVTTVSFTAPRKFRRALAEIILVAFIIFGCYLIGTSRLMWFRLKASNILRKEILLKILRMHVAWHQEPENSPEIIARRLNEDANKASTAISLNQSLTTQMVLNISTAILMIIFADSHLGLITLSILLLLALISTLLDILEKKYQAEYKTRVDFTKQFITDAFDNISTIRRLTFRHDFFRHLNKLTEKAAATYRKICICREVFISFACLAMFFNAAAVLSIGLNLYMSDQLKPEKLIVCVIVPIFTIFELTKFIFLLVDTNATTEASENIFKYFDTRSLIDIEDRALLYRGHINGEIEFRNVVFTYPGNKTPTLKKVSFTVSPGKSVIIAGNSTSGKEVISQLLLRFYDTDSGDILINGVNIRNYNLHYLRKKIGVVFENPYLFPGTVEDNVKYNEECTIAIEPTESTNDSEFYRERVESSMLLKDQKASELSSAYFYARQWTNALHEAADADEEATNRAQRYRITIARAILRRPGVFVFEVLKSEGEYEEGIEVEEILRNVPDGSARLLIMDSDKVGEGEFDVLMLNDGRIGNDTGMEDIKEEQELLLLDV